MRENLSEKDFKKLSLNFRNVASRFLRGNFQSYHENLKRFLIFIDESPIIYEFIQENNDKTFNIEEIIKKREHNNRLQLPIRDSEEIAFVYQMLNYISQHNLDIVGISYGYGGSKKIQSHVEGFNSHVVQPLIDHIVTYLGEMKIDMGLDKKSEAQFTFNREFKGQFNYSRDYGQISAHQIYNEADIENLKEISEGFVKALLKEKEIPEENKEATIEFLEVAVQEAESKRPRKAIIKTAIDKIMEIKDLVRTGSKVFVLGTQLAKLLQSIFA